MILEKRTVIQENDLVILYMGPENIDYTIMKKDGKVSNRFGVFPMSKMLGKKYGFKLYNEKKSGFLYVLRPTPELWTLSLKHRTQILYMPDIAFITQMLDIRPGKVAVESGTGSGSFSHALARSLYPSGRLHTFEFHPERAEAAKGEFKMNNYDKVISVECRNVCTQGFGEKIKNSVNAVFLDLPSPWEAIKFVPEILSNSCDSRICCFSPCIEQVQRTINALNKHGFYDIKMFEVLQRSYDSKRIEQIPIDLGVCTASTAKEFDVSGASEGLESDQKVPLTTFSGFRATPIMKGHTSFLTFASFSPKSKIELEI